LEPIIVADVPFRIDLEDLKKKLHFKEGSPYLQDLTDLVGEAEKVGKPKALFKVAFIDGKGSDSVTIEGTKFKSTSSGSTWKRLKGCSPMSSPAGWSSRTGPVGSRICSDVSGPTRSRR